MGQYLIADQAATIEADRELVSTDASFSLASSQKARNGDLSTAPCNDDRISA